MAPRIVVLGIGNVLMGDDPVGPHVVKLLEAGWEFPPEVSVIEALTVRIALSLTLFALLILRHFSGLLTPHAL